jgi:hypothetical protein
VSCSLFGVGSRTYYCHYSRDMDNLKYLGTFMGFAFHQPLPCLRRISSSSEATDSNMVVLALWLWVLALSAFPVESGRSQFRRQQSPLLATTNGEGSGTLNQEETNDRGEGEVGGQSIVYLKSVGSQLSCVAVLFGHGCTATVFSSLYL